MNSFQKAFAKIKHQQQALSILIFGFVSVMVWIGVSLLSSQRQLTISKELQKLAKPLTPDINRDVLRRLQQKQIYSNEELAEFPIYKLIHNEASGFEEKIEVGEELPDPDVDIETEEEQLTEQVVSENTEETEEEVEGEAETEEFIEQTPPESTVSAGAQQNE